LNGRDGQIEDFLRQSGWSGAERSPLPGDASFRRYHRIRDANRRAMLMDAPPPKEDVRPFLHLARHLAKLGLSAPAILAEDSSQGFLLLEDFGDATFTRQLQAGASERRLYELAVDVLAALHKMPNAIPPGLPPYDDERLLAEAMLLTDWYMPEILGRPTPDEVRASYASLWTQLFPLARQVPDTLVLRDYHVDNLMTLEGRASIAACGLLDFQDAVAGPLSYDLVSLVEDARRDLSPGLAQAMVARYLDQMPGLDASRLATSMAVLGAQRHCKVIGIFTRLMRRDGKPGYLVHIPRLWRLVEGSLAAEPRLAPLGAWLARHLPPELRRVPGTER
jgi:aminoglycoside/choline kinase family phosphotransferase